MKNLKIEELKIKADQGDGNACIDYAVEIYKRFKEDHSQKKEDTKIAYDYILKGIKKDIDNKHKKTIYNNLRKIYLDAKHLNITKEELDDVIDRLKDKVEFNNFGGNIFEINKYTEIEDIQNIIENQKKTDKNLYSTDIIQEIPHLLKSIKNEIDYFTEKLSIVLNMEITQDIIEYLNNVNIVFSYKKEKETYAPSKKDIQALLKKLLKECKNNINTIEPYTLSKLDDLINKVEQADDLDIAAIKTSLHELDIHDDNYKLYKVLADIYSALDITTFFTNGTYNRTKNTITLYLSNIYDKAKELKVRPEYYLINVFSHELFHAYHYKMIKKSFDENIQSNIVIESLASYFQFLYLFDKFDSFDENSYTLSKENELVAKNIYDSWKYDMFIYPYSGAKFMFISNKYIEKRCDNYLFKKIFNYSLTNINKAFDTVKFFYDIANCSCD